MINNAKFQFEGFLCYKCIGRALFRYVFGPPIEDYLLVAPSHSFIHVNSFKSIRELFDYLNYLDQNITAFNEYFEWQIGDCGKTRSPSFV